MVTKYVRCHRCHGEGHFINSLGKDIECPICHGLGKLIVIPKGYGTTSDARRKPTKRKSIWLVEGVKW